MSTRGTDDDDLDPTDILPRSDRLHESADDLEADALTRKSVLASKRTQPMPAHGRAAPDGDKGPPEGQRPAARGLGTTDSDRPPPDDVPTREQETRVRRPKHGTELLGKGPIASAEPPPEARRMRTLPPEDVATRPDAMKRMPRTREVGGVPVLVPMTLAKMEAPKPLPEAPPKTRAKLFTSRLPAPDGPLHADEPEVGPEAMARAAARSEDASRLQRSNRALVAVASALAAVVLVLVFLQLRGGPPAPSQPGPRSSPTLRAALPTDGKPSAVEPPMASASESAAPSHSAAPAPRGSEPRAPLKGPAPPQKGGPLVTD